jgi:hypothetical protein
MNPTQPVVTIEGHSRARRTGPVRLNNVVIDNIGPPSIGAEYVDVALGPGDVNFELRGPDVRVTNEITGTSEPKQCVFPTLPAPRLPEVWYVE